MKVTITDRYAPREGDTVEVTEAAGKRLIDKGWAEKAGTTTKAADTETKAAAKPKKKTAKKAAKKS